MSLAAIREEVEGLLTVEGGVQGLLGPLVVSIK
jgi:hypothetical protein